MSLATFWNKMIVCNILHFSRCQKKEKIYMDRFYKGPGSDPERTIFLEIFLRSVIFPFFQFFALSILFQDRFRGRPGIHFFDPTENQYLSRSGETHNRDHGSARYLNPFARYRDQKDRDRHRCNITVPIGFFFENLENRENFYSNIFTIKNLFSKLFLKITSF